MFGDYDKFYQNIYRPAFSAGDRPRSRSAPTTTATTARTCSARPTSSGTTGSPASTRPSCSASRSAGRNRATCAMTGGFARRQHRARHRSDGRCRRHLRARRRATPTTASQPTSPPSTRRTRSARPTGSRSSPACASTASGSTSTTCAPPARSSAAATICGRRASAWCSSRPADLSLYASYSRSYPAAVGRPVQRPDSITDGLEARAVRQLRGRREVGAARRAARDRGALPARPQQHPRDRPARSVTDGADRQAAQPRARTRPRAQRHQPLDGVCRLHAAEGRDHRDHQRRAGQGREVPLVPRHSFSLWNRYDVTERVGVGLGVIARSKSYATISNAVMLPGYTRVDAALYYGCRGGIEAQLNAENCSARIISLPPTATTTSRPARRGRSRRRWVRLLAREFLRARLDALQVARRTARAPRACGPRPGIRSRKLGCTVTQHSLPSASVSGAPRLADRHRLAEQASSLPWRQARRSPVGGSVRAHARSTSGTPRSRWRRACCGCAACRAARI